MLMLGGVRQNPLSCSISALIKNFEIVATSKVNCKVYLLLLIYHYVLTIVVYAWEKGGYHHGWRQLSLCLLTICRRYLHIQPSTISDTTWDTLVAMNRTITSSISATTWDYLVASSPSYLLVKANTNRTTIKNPEITYILESTDQIHEICTNKYGITCIINIITQIISPPNNGESLEKLFLNHYHPSMNSMIFNSATISTTNLPWQPNILRNKQYTLQMYSI